MFSARPLRRNKLYRKVWYIESVYLRNKDNVRQINPIVPFWRVSSIFDHSGGLLALPDMIAQEFPVLVGFGLHLSLAASIASV